MTPQAGPEPGRRAPRAALARFLEAQRPARSRLARPLLPRRRRRSGGRAGGGGGGAAPLPAQVWEAARARRSGPGGRGRARVRAGSRCAATAFEPCQSPARRALPRPRRAPAAPPPRPRRAPAAPPPRPRRSGVLGAGGGAARGAGADRPLLDAGRARRDRCAPNAGSCRAALSTGACCALESWAGIQCRPEKRGVEQYQKLGKRRKQE
ncbi:atherin-like [Camelus dromedarius]|uniref:atherin-like n=1 Tax=Camelus dromedarius TaxID=9838 RepID=UPI00311951DF